MTCPSLKSRISRLEDEGWITKLEDRLVSDKAALESMSQAHSSYAEERWNLLSPEDKSYAEAHHWIKALKQVGIAGMLETKYVKCLHTHYAHFLARPSHNNIIGLWIHELLNAA